MSLRVRGGTFSTEPKKIQPGVYVGRTLLGSAHHDIAVRAINTTSEPRLIQKDTCLGVLTPVSTVDQGEEVDKAVKTQGSVQSNEPASQVLIDALPTELSDNQRKQMTQMIRSYEDIFSQNEYDIGRTHMVEHTIDTGNNRPIRQQLRRHPVVHLEYIDQQVEEMSRHGIIEPAASPWASNIVLAKKKDGSLRLCVDYRNLNSVTYQDTYPLPHIDTCLNTLKEAS